MSKTESRALDPAGDTSKAQQLYIVPEEVLERIPVDEREEFARKLSAFGIRITGEEHYSGPLHPAAEAERWDALVPGTAERNFKLYEQQQIKLMETQGRVLTITEESARFEMEIGRQQQKDSVTLTRTELKNSADEVKRGQWFAFLVVILIIFGGFLMIHLGHDGGGIASLLVAAASVASIFVSQYTRSRRIASRSQSHRDSVPANSHP